MGRIELLADRMTFSGLGAGVKRISLPRARLERVNVMVEYTVTDAGIVAGEDLDGCIDTLYIGEGSRRPFEVKRDELVKLLDFINPGLTQGQFLDTTPTTATEMESFFQLRGPFNLRSYKNPALVWQMRKITDEFGAASAFTATVYALVEYAENQNLKGAYYHREERATDTRHEVEMGPGCVTEAYLSAGDSKLTKISVGQVSKAMEFVNDVPDTLLHEYQTHKKAAAVTAGRYLLKNIKSLPYPGRNMILDLSETETLVAWMKNLE